MTPFRPDDRGIVVVRIQRAQWDTPGSKFIEAVGPPADGPRRYGNIYVKDNLHPRVRNTLIDDSDVAYWEIEIKHGITHWLSEVTEEEWKMGEVFDEDRDVRVDELAELLIDKCDVQLVNPDRWRFNGLNDEQWEEVKDYATKVINGQI